MLTRMTDEDWAVVLDVFAAARSRRGDKGRDDRRFLEALHFFTVHNITWRALPTEFGKWNTIWKRFWRLSRAGVFEVFFEALASLSRTAHLVQMFDSTIVRAHVSAAGAKGGSTLRLWAAHVGAFRPRFTSKLISTATHSPFTSQKARPATHASLRSCWSLGPMSRPVLWWATRATMRTGTARWRVSATSVL
jgi:transposase